MSLELVCERSGLPRSGAAVFTHKNVAFGIDAEGRICGSLESRIMCYSQIRPQESRRNSSASLEIVYARPGLPRTGAIPLRHENIAFRIYVY